MSDASMSGSTKPGTFKLGHSGNLRGRPTKLLTILKRAQLNIINDLESRALNGDAVARNELFEMVSNTGVEKQ
jgi:hypothetical protein